MKVTLKEKTYFEDEQYGDTVKDKKIRYTCSLVKLNHNTSTITGRENINLLIKFCFLLTNKKESVTKCH